MRGVMSGVLVLSVLMLWGCTSEEPANNNGLVCEGPDCVCEATTCSEHGRCVLTTEGALCICETGYGNTTCDGCAFGYARVESTRQCAPRLSRTLPENAGDNCASGGVALLTGLDLDGNGNLDPSEVDETVYVCSASNSGGEGGSSGSGGTSGTAGNDDDAGVSGEGGSAGSAGSGGNIAECMLDQCGDHGTCMDTFSGPRCYCETAYMGDTCERCAPGYSLSPTRGCIVPNTLTVTEPEPAGTRCQHGGTRIQSGQDLNDNAVLDDNEATFSNYSCNTPLIRTGNVTVASRADLYDLLGVTEITGSLTIIAPLIEDLAPLTALTRVGGSLTISAPRLTDISGLNGLFSVGSELRISGAAGIESLTGFTGLASVRGTIVIEYNTALETIDIMPNLEGCGAFSVTGNASLTSLRGVAARECGQIQIYANSALHSIDAFHALVSSGRVRIADNPALQTIAGFEALTITADMIPPGSNTSVAGHIDIRANAALTSLEGFDALITTNELQVVGNPNLTALPRFDALATANAVLLIDNDSLLSVNGFSGLRRVDRLQIENSAELVTIDAFDVLEITEVTPVCYCYFGMCPPSTPSCSVPYGATSTVLINNNPALITVAGFGNLRRGSTFVIANNPVLTTLPDLTFTATLAELRFENNAMLTELPAIVAPTVTNLTVRNNAALATLMGLGGVLNAGTITVDDNASLPNLLGLATSQAQVLQVTGNASLTSLTDYLGTVSYYVTITNNPMLPQCAAQAFGNASGASNLNISNNDTTATCN